MAQSATFYGSFLLLLLSLVSAIELTKKGCLVGQINPSFRLPYQTSDGSQSFATITFDKLEGENVTVKVDITCSQPIIGRYKASLSIKEGNDSLQMTFESEKLFRSEVKLSSLSFTYMMDEDRFPDAGNDTGKVKMVRASDLISWPQKYAWACYDEAPMFKLNVVNATYGLGPAEISVFSKTRKPIGATCAGDKATYSAPVEGIKGVFAHMNFEAKFNIAYNQSVSGKNTTVTAFNKNLTITDPSASAVPAKKANETGVTFTVTFGSNAAQKSQLNFVFESKMNKTELMKVVLTVFPTPDNGFVNASSKDALTIEMNAEKAGLAWNEAAKGGFQCNAPNTLSDKKEPSTAVLSAFRFQENKEEKTYTDEPQICDADKKSTTTVAPTTTTMPPAPIKHYRYPAKGTPCILLTTGILFDIEYKVMDPKTNKTETKKVRKEVPKHGVTVSGSCNVNEPNNETEQELTLAFNKTWSLTFHISSDKKYTGNENGKAYAVYQVSLDGDVHDGNKTVVAFKGLENNATTNAFKDFLSGSVNKSVTCGDYKQKLSNDKVTVTVELADVQFEAFGANPNGTFSESEQCPGGGGSGSDIIPIIVGACLAALVVVVLVAYLIGRARARRGGYQSV